MTVSNLSRTMTVEEAARELGISRWLAYEQARSGHIGRVPVIRIGRKLLVSRAAVERVLNDELVTADGTVADAS